MEQVAQLRGIVERFTSRGAQFVLIGNGTPQQGREFFAEHGHPQFEVVVDPQLVGYRAAQLKRDLLSGTRPQTIWAFWRARRAGFSPNGIRGDAFQLGGAFVIAPRDEVRYSFVARYLGHHPSLEAMLGTLESSNGPSTGTPSAATR